MSEELKWEVDEADWCACITWPGGDFTTYRIDEFAMLSVSFGGMQEPEPIELSVVAQLLRLAGYIIYAPGAEADRARSDAEIAAASLDEVRKWDLFCATGIDDEREFEAWGRAQDDRRTLCRARIAAEDEEKTP